MPHPILHHARTTGSALKNWFVAQCYDALAVAGLWLIGLLIIGVPLAPFWALLGGAFQFVPQIGAVLGLVGPALAILFSDIDHLRWQPFIELLILYALIAVIDGLFLQPYIMKRTVKVPIWASIFAPIVLGLIIPFWGVLLAPPLLAVLYTYRRKNQQAREESMSRQPAEPDRLPGSG
jgi:predicted PurR-regulated permease PerM